MSLIIGTGSNLGDRFANLRNAKNKISELFSFVAESRVYESKAVEYTHQPDFYNQVLEFRLPAKSPSVVMQQLLDLELELGREREINKGPRIIDIDILFWGLDSISMEKVIAPHPSWNQRSFVVLPLLELPFSSKLKQSFTMPTKFSNSAHPITLD